MPSLNGKAVPERKRHQRKSRNDPYISIDHSNIFRHDELLPEVTRNKDFHEILMRRLILLNIGIAIEVNPA